MGVQLGLRELQGVGVGHGDQRVGPAGARRDGERPGVVAGDDLVGELLALGVAGVHDRAGGRADRGGRRHVGRVVVDQHLGRVVGVGEGEVDGGVDRVAAAGDGHGERPGGRGGGLEVELDAVGQRDRAGRGVDREQAVVVAGGDGERDRRAVLVVAGHGGDRVGVGRGLGEVGDDVVGRRQAGHVAAGQLDPLQEGDRIVGAADPVVTQGEHGVGHVAGLGVERRAVVLEVAAVDRERAAAVVEQRPGIDRAAGVVQVGQGERAGRLVLGDRERLGRQRVADRRQERGRDRLSALGRGDQSGVARVADRVGAHLQGEGVDGDLHLAGRRVVGEDAGVVVGVAVGERRAAGGLERSDGEPVDPVLVRDDEVGVAGLEGDLIGRVPYLEADEDRLELRAEAELVVELALDSDVAVRRRGLVVDRVGGKLRIATWRDADREVPIARQNRVADRAVAAQTMVEIADVSFGAFGEQKRHFRRRTGEHPALLQILRLRGQRLGGRAAVGVRLGLPRRAAAVGQAGEKLLPKVLLDHGTSCPNRRLLSRAADPSRQFVRRGESFAAWSRRDGRDRARIARADGEKNRSDPRIGRRSCGGIPHPEKPAAAASLRARGRRILRGGNSQVTGERPLSGPGRPRLRG